MEQSGHRGTFNRRNVTYHREQVITSHSFFTDIYSALVLKWIDGHIKGRAENSLVAHLHSCTCTRVFPSVKGSGGKSCLKAGNATIFFIDRRQEQGDRGKRTSSFFVLFMLVFSKIMVKSNFFIYLTITQIWSSSFHREWVQIGKFLFWVLSFGGSWFWGMISSLGPCFCSAWFKGKQLTKRDVRKESYIKSYIITLLQHLYCSSVSDLIMIWMNCIFCFKFINRHPQFHKNLFKN